MDAFSALALTVTVSAVGLYALYSTVRRGVADGIRDASRPGSDGERATRASRAAGGE